MMDTPDICPVCRDGDEADKGRCDHCDGAGVVCPIDGNVLNLESRMDGTDEEFWFCMCDWRSTPV